MSAQVQVHGILKSGKLWALVPVLILGAMFAGWGVMLSYALDDPGFGVEPNYYQKAVSFDAYQEQERENQRLGFHLEVEAAPVSLGHSRLVVRVADREGRPLTGARVGLVTFHLARSSHMIEAALVEREPGVYGGEIDMNRAGLWELRLRIERGTVLFTHVTRLDLKEASR
jgi:nitrogen fixation protein FixH